MTEQELKRLRAECRVLAAETVLKLVCTAARRLNRRYPQAALPTVADWIEESQGMTFPRLCPAYSSLYADEAREAVVDLLERIEEW